MQILKSLPTNIFSSIKMALSSSTWMILSGNFPTDSKSGFAGKISIINTTHPARCWAEAQDPDPEDTNVN